MRTEFVGVIGLVAAGAFFVPLSGCEDSSPPNSTVSTTVDPRFATPESLCEYFSSIRSMSRAQQGPAFVDLLYAETAQQELFLRIERNRIRVHRAEQAMLDQYGAPLKDTGGDLRHTPILAAAVLLRSDGERAQARMDFDGGSAQTELQLVKIGDRWWVSLYTMEYAGGLGDRASLEDMDRTYAAMAAAADEMLPRIQAREFRTVDQARVAFRMAIFQHGQRQ